MRHGKFYTCREEYIRLLEQSLAQLGFGALAQKLEQESGVQLEAPEIGHLRSAVMDGEYETALGLLEQLPLTELELRRAQFAVLEQKFLEVRHVLPPELRCVLLVTRENFCRNLCKEYGKYCTPV